MNKILAVLVSTVIITGMMPMMPMTSATSYVQVANKAPVVTNAQCNASALTVNNYYKISFDLQDNNKVKTTKNITVNVWVNSTTEPTTTTEANRSAYIFKWNQTAQTWYGPTYGSTYVDNSSSTNVNTSNAASINVEVVFKLDKIAVPTNTYTWEINVTVYDDGDLTDYDLNTSAFDVQQYSELSAAEAGINFGTADPGAQVGNLSADNTTYQTTVTITSNTQTDINVQGGDFEHTVYGAAEKIYGTRFYFNTTNVTDVSASGKGVVQLSNTSATDAYDTFRNVSDSLSAGITGYTGVKAPGLAFNGSIPTPCAPGTYQATWTITAAATAPQ